MVNKLLIQEGFARVGYIYEPNTRYVEEFQDIQEQAKEKQKNIWSIDGYVTDRGYNVDISEISENSKSATQESEGKIKGNTNSKIYHVSGGKYYDSTLKNVIWFNSIKDAEQAGYRASKE